MQNKIKDFIIFSILGLLLAALMGCATQSPASGTRISMSALSEETKLAFEKAQTQVRSGERHYILLDFYATWCPDSQLMDSLFSDRKIQDLLKEKFAYVKVDVGNHYFNQNRSLIEKYNVKAVTTLVVLKSHDNVIDKKVFEPVTDPAKSNGTMNVEKLWKYLSGFK